RNSPRPLRARTRARPRRCRSPASRRLHGRARRAPGPLVTREGDVAGSSPASCISDALYKHATDAFALIEPVGIRHVHVPRGPLVEQGETGESSNIVYLVLDGVL